MNLHDLYEQYRNKPSENSLSAVLKESQNLIYGIIVKVANHDHDSEDLTQEVLIKVIQNINILPKDTNFGGWLNRTSLNTAINYYHQRQRIKTLAPKIQEMKNSQINESDEETIAIIYQHLSQLEGTDESLILNKFIHQMTYAQMSGLYKLPKSTIESKINNILVKLKASIAKAGFTGVSLALVETFDQLKVAEVSIDLLPKIKAYYPSTYPKAKTEFFSSKILLKVMIPVVAVLIAYFTVDHLNSMNQTIDKPLSIIAKEEKQNIANDIAKTNKEKYNKNQENTTNKSEITEINADSNPLDTNTNPTSIANEEPKATQETEYAGQLIDGETKKPIPDAKLEIWDIYTYEKHETTTDAEGKYFVPKALDTTFFFYLKFLKEGYAVKQTFQHFEINIKINLYMYRGVKLSSKICFEEPEDGELYLGTFINLENENHLSLMQKTALNLVFNNFTYSAPRNLYTYKKIKFEMTEEYLLNLNEDSASSNIQEKFFYIWIKDYIKRRARPLVNELGIISRNYDELKPEITSLETGKLVANTRVKVFRFDTREEFFLNTTGEGFFPNLSLGILGNCILTIGNKDYFCGHFGLSGGRRINAEELIPYTSIEIEPLILNKETSNAQIIFGTCVLSKKSLFKKATDTSGGLRIYDRFFEKLILSKIITVPYGGVIDIFTELNAEVGKNLGISKKYKIEVTVNGVQLEDKDLSRYRDNDELEIRFSKDDVEYTKLIDLKKVTGEIISLKFDKKIEVIESDEFKIQNEILGKMMIGGKSKINIFNENTHIICRNSRTSVFIENNIDYQVMDDSFGVKTMNNQIRAFKSILISEKIIKIELKPVSESDYNTIHIDIYDEAGNEIKNLIWTIRELSHRMKKHKIETATRYEVQEFSVDDAVKQSRTVSVMNNREYFIFIDAPGYVFYHEFILVKEENGRLNKKIIIQKSNTVKLKGDLNNNIYEIAKLLKIGDVMYEYNGVRINNKDTFIKAQQECTQEKIVVKLIRDNMPMSLMVPAYQIQGLVDNYYDDKDGLLTH